MNPFNLQGGEKKKKNPKSICEVQGCARWFPAVGERAENRELFLFSKVEAVPEPGNAPAPSSRLPDGNGNKPTPDFPSPEWGAAQQHRDLWQQSCKSQLFLPFPRILLFLALPNLFLQGQTAFPCSRFLSCCLQSRPNPDSTPGFAFPG